MSDAEVICEFMEPRPELDILEVGSHRWWTSLDWRKWAPRTLTLNECHEVEARLTDKQWVAYREWLCREWQRIISPLQLSEYLLHAEAPLKVEAMAAVLRA